MFPPYYLDPLAFYNPPVLGFARARNGLTQFGYQVERAAAALPQSAQTPYFTIAGGRVLLTLLLGEVTTVIQTQACNLSVVHNVATGTDQALCAVLNITADEVGTLYTLPAAFASALIGTGPATPISTIGIALKPGTLDLLTSASNTGATKWTAWWLPLDEGATLVAA